MFHKRRSRPRLWSLEANLRQYRSGIIIPHYSSIALNSDKKLKRDEKMETITCVRACEAVFKSTTRCQIWIHNLIWCIAITTRKHTRFFFLASNILFFLSLIILLTHPGQAQYNPLKNCMERRWCDDREWKKAHTQQTSKKKNTT